MRTTNEVTRASEPLGGPKRRSVRQGVHSLGADGLLDAETVETIGVRKDGRGRTTGVETEVRTESIPGASLEKRNRPPRHPIGVGPVLG